MGNPDKFLTNLVIRPGRIGAAQSIDCRVQVASGSRATEGGQVVQPAIRRAGAQSFLGLHLHAPEGGRQSRQSVRREALPRRRPRPSAGSAPLR